MEHQQKVRDYFQSIESRLGYDLVLWGSKHFGFYPSRTADISEKQAQELMQDLVAEKLSLREGQEVLDAGCGQGVVATYLARKYACNVAGITIVPFEVRKARALAKGFGLERQTSFHEMDYLNTSFANDTFDAVYTIEALVHSPDAESTLKEFFRVLKPDGRLALFEYTIAQDSEFTDREMETLNNIIEGSAMLGLKSFRHDELPKTIKRIGFENAEEQDITLNVGPSWERLRRIAKKCYRLVKLFHLSKVFFNATVPIELHPIIERGLVRYCIFTARKPASNI
jgi:cyclopropane fatty-acyl-phospholipid synthase-like methyltransferase